MAAYTDAMKWYNLGAGTAARTKYHFKVQFFSSQYPELQGLATRISDAIRSVELPKYSIETEVINAWNVRQIVPTRVNFEPITISFTDTLDNRFQNFIVKYMSIATGSFAPSSLNLRTNFQYSSDNAIYGVSSMAEGKSSIIDKIVITRFYGTNNGRIGEVDDAVLQNKSQVTLWRPKIVDVQHDTLDYGASEAVTWQIGIRYETLSYSSGTNNDSGTGPGPVTRPIADGPRNVDPATDVPVLAGQNPYQGDDVDPFSAVRGLTQQQITGGGV